MAHQLLLKDDVEVTTVSGDLREHGVIEALEWAVEVLGERESATTLGAQAAAALLIDQCCFDVRSKLPGECKSAPAFFSSPPPTASTPLSSPNVTKPKPLEFPVFMSTFTSTAVTWDNGAALPDPATAPVSSSPSRRRAVAAR